MTKAASNAKNAAGDGGNHFYRHSVVVRVTHWITVICLFVLLLSGLQIFNAHPALYWGADSHFNSPLVSMEARVGADGTPVGVTQAFGSEFMTTGFLGLSDVGGEPTERGFPSWLTIPSYRDLATGRRWHFLFAWLFVINGFVYLIYTLLSGHAWRDLVPSREQMRHIGRSVLDHARFRFERGEAARSYNVLQKISYLVVIFLLLPSMVLAGLALSPALDAQFPILVDLFGGRQSARTVHFFAALAIVAFAVVHIFMVLISGLWNNIRSMITGRYAIPQAEEQA